MKECVLERHPNEVSNGHANCNAYSYANVPLRIAASASLTFPQFTHSSSRLVLNHYNYRASLACVRLSVQLHILMFAGPEFASDWVSEELLP